MKNFFNDAASHFKDKFSNPLLPTFVTSWCLWNYKVFVFLFSNISPTDKVAEITNILTTGGNWGYSTSFIPPIFATAIYVFGYPFIFRVVMTFIETQKVKTNKRLATINLSNPRTTKEFNELEQHYVKTQNFLRDRITDIQSELKLREESLSEANQKTIEIRNNGQKELIKTTSKLNAKERNNLNLSNELESLKEITTSASKTYSHTERDLIDSIINLTRIESSNNSDPYLKNIFEQIEQDPIGVCLADDFHLMTFVDVLSGNNNFNKVVDLAHTLKETIHPAIIKLRKETHHLKPPLLGLQMANSDTPKSYT